MGNRNSNIISLAKRQETMPGKDVLEEITGNIRDVLEEKKNLLQIALDNAPGLLRAAGLSTKGFEILQEAHFFLAESPDDFVEICESAEKGDLLFQVPVSGRQIGNAYYTVMAAGVYESYDDSSIYTYIIKIADEKAYLLGDNGWEEDPVSAAFLTPGMLLDIMEEEEDGLVYDDDGDVPFPENDDVPEP